MKRKGLFALSKTAELILFLLGLVVLIMFVYFLRDKLTDFAQKIVDMFKAWVMKALLEQAQEQY